MKLPPPGLRQPLPLGLAGAVAAVVLVLVACAGLLTLLYLRAEAVDPARHLTYSRGLQAMAEADAQVNAELLANRLELSRNYDALAAHLGRAVAASREALAVPDFLPEPDRAEVRVAAEEVHGSMLRKAQMVESFKRANAVLRNSLAYFPVAAEAGLEAVQGARTPAGEALGHYIRHLLRFARTPDPEVRRQVEASRARLLELPVGEVQRRTRDNLLRHGDAIMTTTGEVDALSRSVFELHSGRALDALQVRYADAHAHAARLASRFRSLLYAMVMGLAGYLTYTFLRLAQTRRSLASAHQELTRRYEAQLVVEKQLQLHAAAYRNAHNGITLTDAQGLILDVNPAFTRITGYERSEVIGRSPGLLKSGMHDADFYAAMWKSITETGNWRGEIWNRNKYGEIYPELLSISSVRDAQGVLTNYVAVFADISRIKEQETRLTRLAYFDPLTELPNRVMLADRISQGMAQTRRSGQIMAICYLDLDGFKPVNDTWGHEMGDLVLVEISRRLKESLRGGDTLARLGGDEFVLLLLGLDDVHRCIDAVRRIQQNILHPIHLAAEPIVLSASIGIVLYPEDDGTSDILLRHADQAMYQAKQAGKNRFHFFDTAQDRDVRDRNDSLDRIQQALAAEEFVLHYQPKVNMREGTVIGAEALIRWQHPDRGLLAPAEFLALIEDHELIVQVGTWVIETALRQMEQWQAGGLAIPVSVNVAGRQLQNPDFVQQLSDALARHPGVAAHLELEVLETTALEDMVKVSRVIEECSAMGVSFALDDFGTGYSSLTYLKRLPARTIKIDQSFVREILSDPNNLVIVQGVLGLASAFQRDAIAEGVETVEHGRLLMQLGCDLAQGYGVARPMPAVDFPAWVAAWRPDAQWRSIREQHWEAADYPMLVAEVEHRNWVDQIVQALEHGQPPPHSGIEDFRSCRFGQWYCGRGQQSYAQIPAYQALESLHAELHRLAGEIDRQARDGELEEARRRIPELIDSRDAVLDALKALQAATGHSR